MLLLVISTSIHSGKCDEHQAGVPSGEWGARGHVQGGWRKSGSLADHLYDFGWVTSHT